MRERLGSREETYISYELNLVLRDGSRLNITDHGHLKSLRPEAVRLAEFLDVPLWDFAGEWDPALI